MWKEGGHPDPECGKRCTEVGKGPEKRGEGTAHGGWVGCIAGVGEASLLDFTVLRHNLKGFYHLKRKAKRI